MKKHKSSLVALLLLLVLLLTACGDNTASGTSSTTAASSTAANSATTAANNAGGTTNSNLDAQSLGDFMAALPAYPGATNIIVPSTAKIEFGRLLSGQVKTSDTTPSVRAFATNESPAQIVAYYDRTITGANRNANGATTASSATTASNATTAAGTTAAAASTAATNSGENTINLSNISGQVATYSCPLNSSLAGGNVSSGGAGGVLGTPGAALGAPTPNASGVNPIISNGILNCTSQGVTSLSNLNSTSSNAATGAANGTVTTQPANTTTGTNATTAHNTILVRVAALGPLDAAAISNLSPQFPDLDASVKPGSSLVILFAGPPAVPATGS